MATPLKLDITSDQAEARLTSPKAHGLTHKAYLNACASLLDAAVKGGTLAVVTPIVVHGLGSSLYGVWQILARLIAYMYAADGRPTQALKWVIANGQIVDDDDVKRHHVGSAVGVWLLFLPLLIAISCLLVWISPYVTKVSPDMYLTVRITCALLAVNFLLIQLVSLPEAVLRGMNLGYKRMGWQALLNVIGGALTAGAIYSGTGLIGLAAGQVVLALLSGILFATLVKKFVPWFGIARLNFKDVRKFLNLSIWWFLWTLVSKFLLASDIVILGVVASSSTVATYSLTAFAATTLLSLVTIVLAAVTPGLGGMIGQKQFQRAAEIRVEMMTVSWLLLLAVGCTILLWNRSFIFLWVGQEHYSGSLANLLIVLMIVQLIYIRNDSYVIDLTLQLKEKVILAIVAAIISIALSALLIPRLGIVGLCLGMIIGRLVLTISYPFVIKKQLAQSHGARTGVALRPAAVMTLLFAMSAYFGGFVRADNWLTWIICTGVSFILAMGIGLRAGLSSQSRQHLFKRLAMIRTLSFGS